MEEMGLEWRRAEEMRLELRSVGAEGSDTTYTTNVIKLVPLYSRDTQQYILYRCY